MPCLWRSQLLYMFNTCFLCPIVNFAWGWFLQSVYQIGRDMSIIKRGYQSATTRVITSKNGRSSQPTPECNNAWVCLKMGQRHTLFVFLIFHGDYDDSGNHSVTNPDLPKGERFSNGAVWSQVWLNYEILRMGDGPPSIWYLLRKMKTGKGRLTVFLAMNGEMYDHKTYFFYEYLNYFKFRQYNPTRAGFRSLKR